MLTNSNENSFSIIGMYIYKECEHKKVLKPGYYSLNDAYIYDEKKQTIIENFDVVKPLPNDFFEKNISISAIVGKNGSGKSSLLDMIYRIINNFSCKTFENTNLSFVPNIYADLYFLLDNKINVLSCKGEDVCLNGKYVRENDTEIKKMFYTLVLNYSFQSFIANDYADERKEEERFSNKKIWIDNIFHKNDGYKIPIVLNPYRDNGNIDLNNEFELTKYKISSILIEDRNKNSNKKNNNNTFDDYELEDIKYSFDEDSEDSVLENYLTDDENNVDDKYYEKETKILNFLSILNKNSLAKKILEEYVDEKGQKIFDLNKIRHQNYNSLDFKRKIYVISAMYFVNKIIKIVTTYPNYKEKYKDIKCLRAFFDREKDIKKKNKETSSELRKIKQKLYGKLVEDDIDLEKIRELLNEISRDDSHIAFKIHQIEYFILEIFECKNKLKDFQYSDEYYEYENCEDLDDIIRHLPPSFYKFSIFLKKKAENKEDNAYEHEKISFDQLSSGERQFAYNIATIIYHIKNLLSVRKDDNNRICYRNFNIVLDEVELCFHPEYQRTFIDRLIKVFKNIIKNEECKINIILSTHSPFILSDIPKQNILFLEEGKAISNECKPTQTFAANISDLLKDSFFLADGFIGEFAAEKIGKIIEKIEKNIKKKSEISFKDYKKYKDTIELIGEPIVRYKLKDMLTDIVPKEKKLLLEEITKLEREKKHVNEKLEEKKKIFEEKYKCGL